MFVSCSTEAVFNRKLVLTKARRKLVLMLGCSTDVLKSSPTSSVKDSFLQQLFLLSAG